MVARLKAWVNDVVVELLSSKKSLAAMAVVVVALVIRHPKMAFAAFVLWMVCQTATDIARIIKGIKG